VSSTNSFFSGLRGGVVPRGGLGCGMNGVAYFS
jgi:hypothetical protein